MTFNKSVAFHTLGCKLNFAETSTIAKDFVTKGFARADFSDHAGIDDINICVI